MTPGRAVVFSARARKRLHDIQGYIAFHDIRAATRVADRILYAADMLADHPFLGTEWQGGPTRALAVPGLPYRIHYRVTGERVEVITVAHTRRKGPNTGL